MTTFPGGFPEAPVTPAEAQAARAGVQQRGGRIMSMLGLFAVLSALAGLVGALLTLWAWRALPALLGRLAELNGLEPGLETSALNPAELLPAWAVPSLLALTLLSTVIYVWAMWRARQTIGAIRAQTLTPSAQHAQALAHSAQAVRPWITLGQYTPIIMTLVSLLIVSVMVALGRQLDPALTSEVPFGAIEGTFLLMSVAVQNLPAIVITWLILAAIRRWLDAVVARSTNPSVAVRPLARRVDPWLLFTVILLALGTAAVMLSSLPFLMLPALLGTVPLDDPELLALGLTSATLRALGLGSALLMLLGGVIYLLMTLLMAWSRGFALDVATALDADLHANLQAAHPEFSPDPWSGPVEQAPARPPR